MQTYYRVVFICVLLQTFGLQGFSQNVVKNPGFETDKTGWNYWGGEQTTVAFAGKYGVKVVNTDPKWSGVDQVIMLPEAAVKLEVLGYIKTDNLIKGTQPWEMARIAIEFQNEAGELTGGYPAVTGQVQGTQDWQKYEKAYAIPDGAVKVKLQCAIGNATGTAYFDEISMIIKDAEGNVLEVASLTGPLAYGEWYDLKISKRMTAHYVDWSSLLDAPAGKHGFLQVKDGKFVFEDGTPAKFWGVNIVAANCFPERNVADSVAERLSKMGCNLVRLHHMDAPWSNPNIFGNTGSTRTLSEQSMQKLDYLIYALKKKGIYIFMDLLVHRKFYKEDGVYNPAPDNGGKQVGIFSDKLIELQKEYAENLFTHVNKYTKLAYKDEPAIVASEFINESTIFTTFDGDILTPPYKSELQSKWEAAGNEGKLPTFRIDYSLTGGGLIVQDEGTADIEKSIRFLAGVEEAYYKEMYKALREIGVKFPLAGTNMPVSILANIKNNSTMDFTIVNGYWDHPQLWKIGGDWSRVLYAPIDNQSQIRGYKGSLINTLSRFKVVNKPMIVTEWNHCYPNEYQLEAVPMMASYAALQGWDGLTQFDFGFDPLFGGRITNISANVMPEHMAQWVVAAPLFHKGYVNEAKEKVIDRVAEEEVMKVPSYSDHLSRTSSLPYITKVEMEFVDEETPDAGEFNENNYTDDEQKVINSATNELALHYSEGYLKINTPFIQGATGDLQEKDIELPYLTIKMDNPYGSVLVVSAGDKPLNQSENFYLVVVTPTKMTGQTFNDTRSALKDAGQLPVQAQVAEGTITFNVEAKKYTVYNLTPYGQRLGFTTLKKGDFTFDLSEGRTFVYEVKVKKNK